MEETRKRSRFDQTEPEPKRSSQLQRRSRSPSSRKQSTHRSRSPADANSEASEIEGRKSDPAAAAAAAAARINAQIQAKKSVQHVDVPLIRSESTPGIKSPSSKASASVPAEIYTQDGDYIRDIEVNDLRNRYTLTKGATQKMIKDSTGADVTTRGEYYPDKSMATPSNPPLYLHITSTSKEGLEQAVEKIEELMKQELPNLVDERRFRRREPEQVERDELGRRKWPEERIPINIEPIPGFNLRAQVVGHGGAYVKHIQQESRCRVQIKGRGSGFNEPGTNMESDESMYLHVAGPNIDDVKKAKELCEDLLGNVKEQYNTFKARADRGFGNGFGGGGRGYGERGYGDRGYGDRGYNERGHNNRSYGDRNYGDRERGSYAGYNNNYNSQQYQTSVTSPTGQMTSTTSGDSTNAADYAAQYAQYYGGQDPYAAYGGYQNYVAMYYNYYQQQQQQQQQQQTSDQQSPPGTASGAVLGNPPSTEAAEATAAPPPPPPPSEAPPPPSGSAQPPPPPPSSSPGGYNAVPPPPGM